MVKRVMKGTKSKKDSKGLSTIVATLLIILLTFVAVGIVWVVVRNVIQGGAEQISLGKLTLDLEITQVKKISDSLLNVTVKRNVGKGEIIAINFAVEDSDGNFEIVRKNISMNEFEIRTFELILSKTNASKLRKITIAPVFKLNSGKEVVGDIKDEFKVASISERGIIESSCALDSDCTNDYNSSAFCSGGNSYKTFHNFSCVSGSCTDSTSQILNQTCNLNEECISGICTQTISCGTETCDSGEYCSTEAGTCLLEVSGNTYFVATNGNDNNPGNFTHPFATWQRAVTASIPGDITYIRGGIYQPTTYIEGSSAIGMVIRPGGYYGVGASGTAEAPIRYFAYPLDWNVGNFPILDGSLMSPDVSTGWLTGISMDNVQYIYFKGLTVRNIHQSPPNMSRTQKPYSEVSGIGSSNSANLRFENMVSHDIDGRGFQHWSGAWNDWDGSDSPFESDNTSWINCDAYNLFDRYAPEPGNAADGWKVHAYQGDYLYWEGCRAFNYSDDGFDPSGQSYRTFKNCWAMSSYKYYNLSPDWNIEGNGFKLTAADRLYYFPELLNDTVLINVTNCIAADCVGSGFYNNLFFTGVGYYDNGAHFYNNLAYKAASGFGDQGEIGYVRQSVYRNNIAYGSTTRGYGMDPVYEVAIYYPSIYVHNNNTWIGTMKDAGGWPGWEYNPAVTVTDADFMSLDASQLMRPRKADGSLPDITFGHLAQGSDLINAGAYIPGYHCATAGAHPGGNCVEWYGGAPDIGAFESNY